MTSEVDFALADPSPLGKCTAEIKVSLPEESAELLAMLASVGGKTKSAYIRDLLLDHIHGRAHMVRLKVAQP